jgi:hypothetical protein
MRTPNVSPAAEHAAAGVQLSPVLALKRCAGQQLAPDQQGASIIGTISTAAAGAVKVGPGLGQAAPPSAAAISKKPRLMQQQQQPAPPGTPEAAATAAAAVLPATVKQESGVMDATEDTTTPLPAAAAAPAAAAPSNLKPETEVFDLTGDDDDMLPPLPPSPPAQAEEAPAPAAAAAQTRLPAGLKLQNASSPAEVESAVIGLMTGTLEEVLPRQQYADLMKRLRELFGPMKRGAAVSSAQISSLLCNYAYVQGAVCDGRVEEVVKALEGLDAVWGQ